MYIMIIYDICVTQDNIVPMFREYIVTSFCVFPTNNICRELSSENFICFDLYKILETFPLYISYNIINNANHFYK